MSHWRSPATTVSDDTSGECAGDRPCGMWQCSAPLLLLAIPKPIPVWFAASDVGWMASASSASLLLCLTVVLCFSLVLPSSFPLYFQQLFPFSLSYLSFIVLFYSKHSDV